MAGPVATKVRPAPVLVAVGGAKRALAEGVAGAAPLALHEFHHLLYALPALTVAEPLVPAPRLAAQTWLVLALVEA